MADDGPVLNQINIVVRDMEPMTDFYRLLGVGFAPTPAPWDDHHRSATTAGGADLELDSGASATTWDQGWPSARTGPVIGFGVRSREAVDETYDLLTAAGHRAQQPPYDAFWGARYAVLEDPDGNAVGLMSPVDPDRRTMPPPI